MSSPSALRSTREDTMQMGSLGNENRDLQRGSPGNPQRGSPGNPGKAGEGSAKKEHGCSLLTGAKPVPLPPGTHAAETDFHGSWLFPHCGSVPPEADPELRLGMSLVYLRGAGSERGPGQQHGSSRGLCHGPWGSVPGRGAQGDGGNTHQGPQACPVSTLRVWARLGGDRETPCP